MRAVRQTLKSALRPWIRRHALGQVHQLRTTNVPLAGSIATAMEEALTKQLSAEERGWIDRIEALRAELNRNSNPMPSFDGSDANAAGARTLEQVLPGGVKACTIAEVCRASKSPFWTLLLFKLIRVLKPSTALELGTCLGISAASQAAAQRLNGQGRLITLEGSAARAALSRKHLASLGLDNTVVVTGIFDDTLAAALNESTPIDYAFIDGHHDEHATVKYYEQLLPHLVEETVVVFDDIAWSAGMRRAWQVLQDHPNVAMSIDLLNVGLCVVTKPPSASRHRFRIRMPT
jgi:predicted O-methyltransferase YrrM